MFYILYNIKYLFKTMGQNIDNVDDECINLIMDAYCDYDNGVFKSPANEQIQVESKIFDNAYFGYTKVSVETASKDEKGNYILKKGNKVPVKGATDTEVIPLTDNIDEYFKKNVLPYNPDAFMDRSKDKIGYEIPFTRIFYKFEEPKSSDEIFKEIKELEAEETELMKELFGNE